MLFHQECLPAICRNFIQVIENNPYLKHRFEQVHEYGESLLALNISMDTIKRKIKRLIDRIHDIIGFDLDRELRQYCYQHKPYMPTVFKQMACGFYVWTNILVRLLVLSAMPKVFDIVRNHKETYYEITDGVSCYDIVLTVN